MTWKCYKHSLYVRYNKSSQKAQWLHCSQNRTTLRTVLPTICLVSTIPRYSSFYCLSHLFWMRKVIGFGDEIVAIKVVILKWPQGLVNAEAFYTFRLDSLKICPAGTNTESGFHGDVPCLKGRNLAIWNQEKKIAQNPKLNSWDLRELLIHSFV